MPTNLPEIIFVTGAGRGIGREIARTCARRKTTVVCISQSESCERTCAEIAANGGKAVAMRQDISDYVSTRQRVLNLIAQTGARRIGIAAAAAILGPQGPFEVQSLADWDRTFQVNLMGNLAIVQAVLPIMIQEKFGRILTFAGGGSAYAYPIFPAYAASKSALVRTVENLAESLSAARDIAIVCVSPGAIETDMMAAIKAAGAEVRTKGDLSLVLAFVTAFMNGDPRTISGRLVHVRDSWQELLAGSAPDLSPERWKLRRVE